VQVLPFALHDGAWGTRALAPLILNSRIKWSGQLYPLTALIGGKELPLSSSTGQGVLEKGGTSRPCTEYKTVKFRPIVRCICERLHLYISLTRATVELTQFAPAISNQSAVFDLR